MRDGEVGRNILCAWYIAVLTDCIEWPWPPLAKLFLTLLPQTSVEATLLRYT